jgi:copper(I)-binding protein
MKTFAWIVAALFVGLSGPAAAHDFKMGAIGISHPWVRATTIKVTGAFMSLTNTGKQPDRLVSATSPAAARVEIHISEMKDGIASMHKVDGVALPPGKTVMLKPGGYHVMLMGLKFPVRKGGKVPITLRFEKAGVITITAEVASPGAMKHSH